MTNHLKERVLTSMGYRLLSGDIWAKPIGYMLFTFSLSSDSIHSNFIDKNGKKTLWESQRYREGLDGGLLDFIKAFEAFTRNDVISDKPTSFEFKSPEDNRRAKLTVAA